MTSVFAPRRDYHPVIVGEYDRGEYYPLYYLAKRIGCQPASIVRREMYGFLPRTGYAKIKKPGQLARVYSEPQFEAIMRFFMAMRRREMKWADARAWLLSQCEWYDKE